MPAKSEHVNSEGPLGYFGALILRNRKARGWTVRDLSARSGVTLMTCSEAERGLRDIRLTSALKLAAALGIDLCDIADDPGCSTCRGVPPPGFQCNECGRGERRLI